MGFKWKAFVGGLVLGTAGLKVLTSKDAKKVYTRTAAAALRAKEEVMTTVTKIKENADDIIADANDINEQYAAENVTETIEDTSETVVEETVATEDVVEAAQ